MDNSIKNLFLCKKEGCNMLFTEGGRICVHIRKHGMQSNISLENKPTNMFVDNADPTPTPTLLINNCEEIGLFHDLKHVNPNVETFQRAVESKQINYHQQQQHHHHHRQQQMHYRQQEQQQQYHHHHQQQQQHQQQQKQQQQQYNYHHQQQRHHHQQYHHHHQQQQQHISTDDNGTYDTASANNCLITNEDSLHTPHVYPNVGSATTATAFCQREDFLMPAQEMIVSESTLIDNHEKTCNTNSTSQLSNNIEIDVKKYRPRQKKTVSGKNNNKSLLQKHREASAEYSEQIKRKNANVKEKDAQLIAKNKKRITKNEMLKTTGEGGEGCLSNTSSNNPSQNAIEPVIETPKYIRWSVIVPNIAFQQNQQRPQSAFLKNNDTNPENRSI